MQRAEGRPRGRGLLLAAALVTAVLSLLAVSASAEDFGDFELTQSSSYLLRLPDLPPGYEFDEGDCDDLGSQFELDDVPPSVATFIRQYHPEGCLFNYERRFVARGGGPSSPEVTSGAMVMPSVGIAEMAAATMTDLVGYITGDDGGFTEVPAAATLGDVTRVFHGRGDDEAPEGKFSFVFWRDGAVLAGLGAFGKTYAAADAAAFAFAARQQAHVEAPSRFTAADADNSLVELDDPRLRTPVYWLGEKFAPSHGFPSTRPYFAFGRSLFGSRKASAEFVVGYTAELLLIGWTRSAWARIVKETDRHDWTWRCTRSRRVKLRQGHAVVYAAYDKNYAICPNRPPRHYFAHAFIGRAMVGINDGVCGPQQCSAPYFSRPFNSFRGMAAVVRGLQVRPPRH
jgi:hypothetical protein